MIDPERDDPVLDAPDVMPSRVFVFGMILRIGLGLALGLFAADRIVGAIDRERDDRVAGQIQMDSALGWTNTPGFAWEGSSINSLGLRNQEIPADAPADELRVLGIGASRVFGSGVFSSEDVWDHLLERLLVQELGAGQPVRVLNGAVKGYSAMQGARRAMRLIPELEPDLVVVFAGAGSQTMLDPSDAQDWVTLGDGRVVPRDIVAALPGPLAGLGVTLHQMLLHSNLYLRYRAQFETAGSRPPTLLRFMYMGDDAVPPLAREMFDNTVAEWRVLREFCAARDVALRVVVLPEAYQMNDEKWAQWLRYGATRDVGSPPLDTPRLAPTFALDALLQSLGFTTWLFRDELERMGQDVDTFTHDSRHWNEAGHRVIALGLFKRLREDGLLETLVARRRAAPR